jgi:hypothetical protein
MTDTKVIDRVRKEIVADSDLDYVSLGQVVFCLEEALATANHAELRRLALSVIEGLLADRLVEAGMADGENSPARPLSPGEDLDDWLARAKAPTPGNWQFDLWPGSPSEIIERISSAWTTSTNEVDLDAVCWFRATDEGRRKVGEWRAERLKLHRS